MIDAGCRSAMLEIRESRSRKEILRGYPQVREEVESGRAGRRHEEASQDAACLEQTRPARRAVFSTRSLTAAAYREEREQKGT